MLLTSNYLFCVFVGVLMVLLFLAALSVFVSTNTIFSTFSLILVFISSSIALFISGMEFFSIIYATVYVGAISVFFLFILMTINLRFEDTWEYNDEITLDKKFGFTSLLFTSFLTWVLFYQSINLNYINSVKKLLFFFFAIKSNLTAVNVNQNFSNTFVFKDSFVSLLNIRPPTLINDMFNLTFSSMLNSYKFNILNNFFNFPLLSRVKKNFFINIDRNSFLFKSSINSIKTYFKFFSNKQKNDLSYSLFETFIHRNKTTGDKNIILSNFNLSKLVESGKSSKASFFIDSNDAVVKILLSDNKIFQFNQILTKQINYGEMTKVSYSMFIEFPIVFLFITVLLLVSMIISVGFATRGKF